MSQEHCTQCGKNREIVGSCHHCGGKFCEDCCGVDCCDDAEDDENDLIHDLNDEVETDDEDEPPQCKKCSGTGLIDDVTECKDCDGTGYEL
jgi:hypothetical protein